jgi:hypothetical protein
VLGALSFPLIPEWRTKQGFLGRALYKPIH